MKYFATDEFSKRNATSFIVGGSIFLQLLPLRAVFTQQNACGPF
jgi:hypothetical protein